MDEEDGLLQYLPAGDPPHRLVMEDRLLRVPCAREKGKEFISWTT